MSPLTRGDGESCCHEPRPFFFSQPQKTEYSRQSYETITEFSGEPGCCFSSGKKKHTFDLNSCLVLGAQHVPAPANVPLFLPLSGVKTEELTLLFSRTQDLSLTRNGVFFICVLVKIIKNKDFSASAAAASQQPQIHTFFFWFSSLPASQFPSNTLTTLKLLRDSHKHVFFPAIAKTMQNIVVQRWIQFLFHFFIFRFLSKVYSFKSQVHKCKSYFAYVLLSHLAVHIWNIFFSVCARLHNWRVGKM